MSGKDVVQFWMSCAVAALCLVVAAWFIIWLHPNPAFGWVHPVILAVRNIALAVIGCMAFLVGAVYGIKRVSG